jgi:hypothetical protein
MASVAQRLAKSGVPMEEFPQTTGNLTAASTNLYEALKGRNFLTYPDAAIRLSMSHAVAVESSRGWRIAKEKQAHRIDIIVALAQAALGAVEGQQFEPGIITYYRENLRPGEAVGGAPGFEAEEENELIHAYEEARAEAENAETCSGCRMPFPAGLTGIVNRNGKFFHPSAHGSKGASSRAARP